MRPPGTVGDPVGIAAVGQWPGLPAIGYGTRVDRVREVLAERFDLRRLLLTDPVSVRWCTGFGGSSAAIAIGADHAVLVTDPRYLERARAEIADAGVPVEVMAAASAAERSEMIVTVIGEGATCGANSARMTQAQWRQWSERLVLTPVDGLIEDLRRVKEPGEAARMERAARIAASALDEVSPWLVPGITEAAVRNELEYRMRRLGADDAAYPTIVAAGPDHSARPHHAAGGRQLCEGDLVVIDVGALVDGYHSDMTRTFHIGEPSPAISELYDLVKVAQQAGLAAVRAGVPASAIDDACREVARRAGLEHEYLHIAGHGVGLEIHEVPFHAPGSAELLRAGDVVTVEPGLYRVGFGGVRIEDLVMVTDDGHQPLSSFPKDTPCLPSPPTT